MSDATTRLLAERIGAIVERVKILAGERDRFRHEAEELSSRVATTEREHSRLRNVLGQAVRDLRQE